MYGKSSVPPGNSRLIVDENPRADAPLAGAVFLDLVLRDHLFDHVWIRNGKRRS